MSYFRIKNTGSEELRLEMKFGWNVWDPCDPALGDHTEIVLMPGAEHRLGGVPNRINICYFKCVYDWGWMRADLPITLPGELPHVITGSADMQSWNRGPARMDQCKAGPAGNFKTVQLGTSAWRLRGAGPLDGTFLLWYLENPAQDPDDPNTTWGKVMWTPTVQMDAKDIAGAFNENGSPCLVVVGGDSKLLYRHGPATDEFLNFWSGYFSWPDPRTPIMEAERIVSVVLGAEGIIRVTVIGGDGKTCKTSQVGKSSVAFSGWSCH
jgi:hypothetical protein